MTDDLTALACPFCGSVAKWTHHQESYRHEDGVERVVRWQSSLRCTGCRLPHCSGFGQVEWMGGNALAQQHAMRLVLEQWNRRTAPPGYVLVLVNELADLRARAGFSDGWIVWPPCSVDQVAAAVAREREACAAMFDANPNAEMFRQDIADAIRKGE